MENKITPFFWFEDKLSEVTAYYRDIFNRDGKVYFEEVSYHPLSPEPNRVEMATVKIFGITYHFMGTKRYDNFTDAVSFMITTEDQAETDYYWDAFTKDGKESACGWCKDKYGLSWQITPKRLLELNASADKAVASYAMQQMMTMRKIVIKDLER